MEKNLAFFVMNDREPKTCIIFLAFTFGEIFDSISKKKHNEPSTENESSS